MWSSGASPGGAFRGVCGAADATCARCGDATTTWRRFALGLGMSCVAKSDQSTGNATYASYALRRVPWSTHNAAMRALRASSAALRDTARAGRPESS
jgi:hypothetical protein